MQTIVQYVQINGPLKLGASGDIVVLVQTKLTAAGYTLKADGDFGPITRTALKDFQGRNGLTGAGALGEIGGYTAKLLDDIQTPTLPEGLIHWFLMYGLGDRSTSAGMDVLGAALTAASKRFVVSPTYSWTQRDQIVARIKKLPTTTRIMLAGNSMGANAIPMVTNACPEYRFDFVAGYDPTIFWSCPAFQGNVKHALLFHGLNWLNPIGHARYTAAFPTQVETVNTWTFHSAIDDDIGLHAITKARALRYTA